MKERQLNIKSKIEIGQLKTFCEEQKARLENEKTNVKLMMIESNAFNKVISNKAAAPFTLQKDSKCPQSVVA